MNVFVPIVLKKWLRYCARKKKKILLIEKWPIGPKEVWIRVLLHNKKKSNNFLILNPSHVAIAVVVGSTP